MDRIYLKFGFIVMELLWRDTYVCWTRLFTSFSFFKFWHIWWFFKLSSNAELEKWSKIRQIFFEKQQKKIRKKYWFNLTWTNFWMVPDPILGSQPITSQMIDSSRKYIYLANLETYFNLIWTKKIRFIGFRN